MHNGNYRTKLKAVFEKYKRFWLFLVKFSAICILIFCRTFAAVFRGGEFVEFSVKDFFAFCLSRLRGVLSLPLFGAKRLVKVGCISAETNGKSKIFICRS